MKKVLLLSVAIAMAGTYSSCKKDYTCECTFTNGSPAITIPLDSYKKADAEDACDQSESTYKVVDPGASCVLK